ncbi:MAG: hypothetical protein AAF515_00520 [Pseudomonadota bacterium]
MGRLKSALESAARSRAPWRGTCARATAALLALLCAGPALAYDGKQHQQLMFLAARQYNVCVEELGLQPISALEIRYAARAAVEQADASVFRRMFRWGFYEREQQTPKSSLWVVETRMHEHFNELLRSLSKADTARQRFSLAGRIAAYVQDVSSPVRVVPIYTTRFWRFDTNDRFDNYSIAERDVAAALADSCSVLVDDGADYDRILRDTAEVTIDAIRQPIDGLPTTWQAFWRLASDPSDFGEYGAAGNRFGVRTQFRCAAAPLGDATADPEQDPKERCVLLKADPLYLDFARSQHVLAVVGTMRVLHRLQHPLQPVEMPDLPGATEAPDVQPSTDDAALTAAPAAKESDG